MFIQTSVFLITNQLIFCWKLWYVSLLVKCVFLFAYETCTLAIIVVSTNYIPNFLLHYWYVVETCGTKICVSCCFSLHMEHALWLSLSYQLTTIMIYLLDLWFNTFMPCDSSMISSYLLFKTFLQKWCDALRKIRIYV